MSAPEHNAVFLSYASQDVDAARRVCEALRAAGVEVWFDQSELVGGDAWDAKIRKQIKECALFVPIISANTQARLEGYFRLEWKLAAQRTHTMADEKAFLLPVVIDDTRDAEAKVPAEFKAVQWTKLLGGAESEKFCVRVQRLLGGTPAAAASTPEAAGELPPRPAAKMAPPTRWLKPVLAGVIVVTAALLAVTLKTRSGPAPASAASSPSSPALVRVRSMLDKFDVTRAELDLAGELLAQAAKSDPANARVFAAWATVDCRYLSEYFDRSAERRNAASRHMAQATGLDAGDPEVRIARATTMRGLNDDDATRTEARTLLEALQKEIPDDPRILGELGTLAKDMTEAERWWDRQARVPGWEAAAGFNKALRRFSSSDFRGAYAALTETSSHVQSTKVLLWRSYLEIIWLGDLAKARDTTAKVPADAFVEDMAASHRYFVAFWSRDYQQALAAVQAVPRDFMESGASICPTGFMRGVALDRLGRSAAAENEWRAALAATERRIEADRNNSDLLIGKAILLAVLHDKPAAEQVWRTAYELQGGSGDWINDYIAAILLPPDQELVRLEKQVHSSTGSTTAAVLRLNPYYDHLRDNPRFVALQAEADADPRLSPTAPDRTRREQPNQPPDANLGATTVAVLPFANLSGDKEQEYFSDGLTEEILNALARERDLRVPGRSSSFSFKGRNLAAAEIAQALGVTQLVEGSVRRSGNRVRISVSLTRAADGFSEEIGTFTEELADVFALEDKVARAVVEKLTHRASSGAPAAVALTTSPEAYDAYLRGRALQTRSAQNAPAAAQYYERAVAIDPKFALAWTRLASARLRPFGAGTDSSAELIASVRFAIARALEAQPNLPEALIARANLVRYVNFDFAAAARDLNAAGSLQPPTADLRRAQALLAWDEGEPEVTLRRWRESMELDPQDGDFANAAALFFEYRGEVRAADELYRRAIAIQGPEKWIPFTNRALLRGNWRGPEAALRLVDRAVPSQAGRELLRAGFLVALGRMSQARQVVEAAARAVKDTQSVGSLSYAGISLDLLSAVGLPAMARQNAETQRADAERELQRGNSAPIVRSSFINAEIFLGHTESALTALADWRQEAESWPSVLRRSYRFSIPASALYGKLGRAGDTVALIREMWAHGIRGGFSLAWNPSYDRVRNDPEFQRLLKEEAAWWAAQPDPVDL